MNKKEWLLTQLASECLEVAHRATKSQHFGMDEIQPSQPLTNHDRLLGEIFDTLGSLSLLKDEGVINFDFDDAFALAVTAKKTKVLKYLKYADEQCGTVSPRLKQERRRRSPKRHEDKE